MFLLIMTLHAQLKPIANMQVKVLSILKMVWAPIAFVEMYEAIRVKASMAHQPQTPMKAAGTQILSTSFKSVRVTIEKKGSFLDCVIFSFFVNLIKTTVAKNLKQYTRLDAIQTPLNPMLKDMHTKVVIK